MARRLTGRAAPGQQPEPGGGEPGPEDPRVLVGRIAEHARADAGIAAQLCQWAAEHSAALHLASQDQSTVHNTVAEGAAVQGPVIQARDIHGGVSFGG